MTSIAGRHFGRPFQPRAAAALARALRVRTDDPAWVAAATMGVVALAAVVYVVNLTVSGYANTYYSAAALAGAQSWSAWFFGSLDPANFITTDKPPLATMLMGLSVRLFGLSSWSILLPQAIAGVATVALVVATVRRTSGSVVAVIAGLVTALTPVAVLMFRYNNPDALLTLLLVGAAYAFVRALESGALRWLALAAGLVGFGFLTKYLQAYLVLPAFGVSYAVAAPVSVRRRFFALVIAAATVVISSGWWVVIMELLPAGSRPYVGGSQTNSVLELLLGYDGLARIFGQGPRGGGAGGGPGGGGGFSGSPGLLRLFNAEFGGQIAWLLPLSLASIGIGLWARRDALRVDLARAGYLMWGLWLVAHIVVFSFMSGIIHTYYAVAMAPAIGALVGGGLVELWRLRHRVRWGGLALGAAIVGLALLAWELLERIPAFAPGLGIGILALGAVVALVLGVPAGVIRGRVAAFAGALGVAVLLAGPAPMPWTRCRRRTPAATPRRGPPSPGRSRRQPSPGAALSGHVPPGRRRTARRVTERLAAAQFRSGRRGVLAVASISPSSSTSSSTKAMPPGSSR
ncbi:MAG: glycosyltransferase family 39 protein [Chloroflexota bacterium]|nr:glycosyltransferase family 39 protein [Chloroflexota bacterium]